MKLLKCGLWALWAALLGAAPALHADEASIRKNLGERVPQMQKIEEVSKTAMPGLFEVRIGTDLYYTDADGNFLIQGLLMDTKTRRNLTEERDRKSVV